MKRESFLEDSPPVVNTLMYFAYVLARVDAIFKCMFREVDYYGVIAFA